ncbi:MAG: flippase-like domain-containing protein [Clostridia bacterium]|nr:flippase-like domain-containing protein [Clostridia bacterium]MDY5263736.1 flippase-like domain-containing protein [Eubacteriales bacterium]MDY5439168.1 flippase-like domain-containing protein [Eubacteriales bacterium]
MDDNKNTATKYDSKKVVRMIILGSAITIFIMTMILSFNDFEGIVEVLKTTNVKYLMFAILLLLVYAILYPITLCILTRTKKCKISMLNTYLIGSTEHFFNGITPFATGGQPFQVYAYNRLGVKPADSTGILMMNFIIFMIVTNIYALASLFYYPQLAQNISNLNAMVIIGFAINFFVLIFLISVATTKRIRIWLEKILIWLCRFKWLKKFVEPNIPKFNDYCYQAQGAFKELWHHKGAFLSCFVIKFITMGVYYAITFFILKALNVDVGPDKLVFIICSTAFAITMCVFIPTPGGSGGIEFAFKSIFQAVAVGITAEVAMGGMLLWRLLSYYLMMLLSFFIYLALEKITLKREKDIMKILPRIKKKTGIGKEENLVTDVVVNEDNFGENIESVETENSELDTNIDSDRVDNQEMENLETCEQFTSEIVEEEENKKDVELASEDNVEIK